MEVLASSAGVNLPAAEVQAQVNFREHIYEMIAADSLDYNSWISLISEVEKAYPDNIDTISLVYDSFLSKYPLCHLYWKKYAYHKASLCTIEKAVEIFEQAVQSVTHSVGLWLDYCSFAISVFEDPFDVRRLFKRGLSFVGKDYYCHTLWDKFIKFEFSQQQWGDLAYIYIQTLRFPTKKLHAYYDDFKKFVAILEEEMQCENNCSIEVLPVAVPNSAVKMHGDEISNIIKDLEDPSNGSVQSRALHKYMCLGEQFYHKSCQLYEKINCFESFIQRLYFDLKPLDENQLETWHHYLDFVEKQEDFDWTVKLYERCLIPCANYPEFWMRYVEFMETKGGREIANFALQRSTHIFFKNVPEIHLFGARFKELTRDVPGARAAFLQCRSEFNSHFVEYVIKEANMERRLGNFAAAADIYEKALKMAAETQNLNNVPSLYIHYSRLKYMITGSSDAAREVIMDGIQHLPHCRVLLEELIKFAMMYEGSSQVSIVDSIIAKAISPDPDLSQRLDTRDREDISCLYLEFVDLCGTIHEVRKAWNRHIKLFPQLIRITSSYKYPTTENLPSDVTMVERQTNPSTSPDHPSVGHNSHHLTQLPVPKKEPLLPENHVVQPDKVVTCQSQPEDNENSIQEYVQHLSPEIVVQSGEDACGVNESADGIVHSSNGASGRNESSYDLTHQPKEDESGPMDPTHDLAHQSKENKSGPVESSHGFKQPLGPIALSEASQEFSKSVSIQQEQDHAFEQNMRQISLESLSLNSQEKQSQDLIPMASDDCDIFPELSTSNGSIQEVCQSTNGRPIISPNRTPADDSAQIQNKSDENELVNLSSFASNENPTSPKTHTQPDFPPNSGEHSSPRKVHPQPDFLSNSGVNGHQINCMVTTSGGANSGFRGHSWDEQQQQQQLSSQQRDPAGEMGDDLVASQSYPHHPFVCPNSQIQKDAQVQNQYQAGATQSNLTSSHARTLHDVPQQSSVSASNSQMSPQPVSCTLAQLCQSPMQNSQHLGNTQHNQAYNQMLQYHYQQQQLLQQQYHQQVWQMQPPYLQQQQQFQQPHDQQLPLLRQQQYLQQQQQHQPPSHQPQQLQQQYLLYLQQQHQQEQWPLYQQFIQQLLPQQGQQQYQMEVQERERQLQQYYQFGLLAYHQHQQGYQQQSEQGYQVLLKQYQLQQQEAYQQMQQQQQNQQSQPQQRQLQQRQQQQQQPEKQQQQDEEQWQHQQHMALTQNLPQKRSHYQLGEGLMAAASTDPVPSESAHLQQCSPQAVTPSRAAGSSRPAVSPPQQQLLPHELLPSHAVGTSRTVESPVHE